VNQAEKTQPTRSPRGSLDRRGASQARTSAWRFDSGLKCGGDSLVERFESLGANSQIAVTAQYRSWRKPGPIRTVGSGPDLARGPRPRPLPNLIDNSTIAVF
jgi:hypothetical protein